jgi:hypothetical protein
MTVVTGVVENGTIKLDAPVSLPDGTRVTVTVEEPSPDQPTLLNLLKLAGAAKDLPPDFAAEHDLYIHGTPRRTQAGPQ